MSEEINGDIPNLRSKTVGSWGPPLRQSRDEALRAENADIDAIAEEFGLSQQTVAIIKDWKSGQFGKIEITRRNGANIRTVNKWVSIVDPNWKLREITQNHRPLSIKAALLDYPDEPDAVIASFFKIRPATVKYFRQGLEATRRKTSGKDRRAPLSIAERKIALEELFREPRPIARLIAQKIGLREQQTISELAHQYWIILGKTGTTIDLASLLEAAKKQVKKYYLGTTHDIKLAIEEFAKQPGWISQLDAMRPWPDSPEFHHADAVLSYYLQGAGVKGPQDLQLRTDVNKILRLKMPEDIFFALNLALSGRAVIFNRRNLRLAKEKGLHQSAPKNESLAEACAATLAEVAVEVPATITDSPFAARFRKTFPTLAELIPTSILAKKETLWRSVSQYWPDQSRFNQELDKLLSTKQICNFFGLRIAVLPMTFVREFGRNKPLDQIFSESEYIAQLAKLEDLRNKGLRFARLIEANSTNLPHRETRMVDMDTLGRWLTKQRVESGVKNEIVSYFAKPPTACPVVNGELTSAARHVMKKMQIPENDVIEIFKDEMAAASSTKLPKPSRPKTKNSPIALAAAAADS